MEHFPRYWDLFSPDKRCEVFNLETQKLEPRWGLNFWKRVRVNRGEKFEFSDGGKTKKVLRSYCCNAMNYTFLIWITKYKLVRSYRCQRPRYSMTLQSFAMLTFWQKQWFLDNWTHSERFKTVSPKNQAINYIVYRCQVSITWNCKACKLFTRLCMNCVPFLLPT